MMDGTNDGVWWHLEGHSFPTSAKWSLVCPGHIPKAWSLIMWCMPYKSHRAYDATFLNHVQKLPETYNWGGEDGRICILLVQCLKEIQIRMCYVQQGCVVTVFIYIWTHSSSSWHLFTVMLITSGFQNQANCFLALFLGRNIMHLQTYPLQSCWWDAQSCLSLK